MVTLPSHSMGFHEKASLTQKRAQPSTQKLSQSPTQKAFTLTGDLETEDSDEMRHIVVFVIVEQTNKTGGKAVATGYQLVEGEAKSLKSWSAKVTVQGTRKFIPGPATGTALTVEFKNDPIGFETYTWTAQITLTE